MSASHHVQYHSAHECTVGYRYGCVVGKLSGSLRRCWYAEHIRLPNASGSPPHFVFFCLNRSNTGRTVITVSLEYCLPLPCTTTVVCRIYAHLSSIAHTRALQPVLSPHKASRVMSPPSLVYGQAKSRRTKVPRRPPRVQISYTDTK